jgi:tetratricopeptide (TPR) repeat protein
VLLKNFDKALVLIEQVLADHPDHTEALILAGRIYQQREDLARARVLFERAIVKAPQDPNLYLYLGRIYWTENDLVNAERVFRQMIDRFPDSYAAHYFSGKVLAALEKTDQAESAFRRALELEPSLEEPRFELVKIYEEQKRSAEVIQIYQDILDYNPENVMASLDLALHYRSIGMPDKGLPLLLDLGRRSENDNGILTYLFENYVETKKYTPASWAIEGMLDGAPDNSDLHFMAGVAYDGMKQVADALNHLAHVAPDSRFYTNAVVHRALLLRESGKMDQSIEVMQTALSNDPQNAEYYLYIGSFYEELERYEEAIVALKKGLANDERNARLHFRMGVISDKLGRRHEAIASIKRVLELQPEDTEALNYLGYTYADMGIHLNEAEALIQNALQKKPDDGYITDSLAWVYFKQGRFEEALKWLTKAEKLVPDDPVILEHLGDVHRQLNSKDKALKYYKRSLEMKKEDGQLQQKIRSLTPIQ